MMNSEIYRAVRSEATAQEQERLDQAWQALEHALPEPDTSRMKRRLQWLLLRQWSAAWLAPTRLAVMAAILIVGIFIGRLAGPGPVPGTELDLHAELLAEVSIARRLNAMAVLRDARQPLPAPAVVTLGRIVLDKDASTGLRLAAVEALVAHGGQTDVGLLLEQISGHIGNSPLIESRLVEAGVSGSSVSL